MKYVIGNWKANKNLDEAKHWINAFLSFDFKLVQNNVTIIICPPYPFIPLLKENTVRFPFINIGSQDVSLYYQGSYTGEVTAHSLSGLADYAIIGHSERREHFKEANQALFSKVEHANKTNIKPIFCVRGENDELPRDIRIVAYEPVSAIGTGQNDSVDNILDMKEKLKLPENTIFIYGGSVTEENAHQYLIRPEIDGVLPGGASLDPHQFYNIVLSTI